MTFIQEDQNLYERLNQLYKGSVSKVAELCDVHRNTVRRVLAYGMPSPKRSEIRKAAEDVIEDYTGRNAAQRTEKEAEAAA